MVTTYATSAAHTALAWLDGWMHSGGFGGGAALLAALIAYQTAASNRRAESARHREARWWDQARWAFQLAMSKNPQETDAGARALSMMVAEAKGTEAAMFAQMVLESIAVADTTNHHPDDEPQTIDEKKDQDAQ